MRILATQQADEWTDTLRRTARHDFYFLPGYHAIAERQGEGRAQLFVFERDGYLLAMPLLLRPLGEIAGLGGAAEGWHDATSVYGYAGPLSSHEDVPEPVVRDFQAALREALLDQRVITAFSRLHPLLPQRELLAGLGECRPCGQTVSVDLTLPREIQRTQYRSAHKSRLNKLHRQGVVCIRDEERRHLPEFISIYHESMRRVNAQSSYFFGADYFTRLAAELGDKLQLFVVMVGETVASAGLFVLCDGIVQYHLGGTRDSFLRVSPKPLLLDTVRLWGNEVGARVLHLGGGVGSRSDSLFFFKAGFSDCRHDFATWRWIVVPEVYRELCDERRRLDDLNDSESVSADFFPAYRCPAAPPFAVPGELANT